MERSHKGKSPTYPKNPVRHRKAKMNRSEGFVDVLKIYLPVNTLSVGAKVHPTIKPKAINCDQNRIGRRPYLLISMTAKRPPHPTENHYGISTART